MSMNQDPISVFTSREPALNGPVADPLTVLPPEIVLRILDFTPVSALASLTVSSTKHTKKLSTLLQLRRRNRIRPLNHPAPHATSRLLKITPASPSSSRTSHHGKIYASDKRFLRATGPRRNLSRKSPSCRSPIMRYGGSKPTSNVACSSRHRMLAD
jgi:hypothetical protein